MDVPPDGVVYQLNVAPGVVDEAVMVAVCPALTAWFGGVTVTSGPFAPLSPLTVTGPSTVVILLSKVVVPVPVVRPVNGVVGPMAPPKVVAPLLLMISAFGPSTVLTNVTAPVPVLMLEVAVR